MPGTQWALLNVATILKLISQACSDLSLPVTLTNLLRINNIQSKRMAQVPIILTIATLSTSLYQLCEQ